MRNHPTVRRRCITLIRKDDPIRIVLARAVFPAFEDRSVACVAHQWVLEELAVRAVRKVEFVCGVEDPLDRIKGGLGPVLKFVGIGVLP